MKFYFGTFTLKLFAVIFISGTYFGEHEKSAKIYGRKVPQVPESTQQLRQHRPLAPPSYKVRNHLMPFNFLKIKSLKKKKKYIYIYIYKW